MNEISARDIPLLGQVFTPDAVVAAMVALRRRAGRVLEPACGDGAFLRRLPGAVGVEIDPRHCPAEAVSTDFFAYPEHEKFATVIGNPPYVRYQDIGTGTRGLLNAGLLDARSNLYLFFIEKAIRHLEAGGELIFITPRDFLKTTSSTRLNFWLFDRGTITDAIELGDTPVFSGVVPNCLIWRYELGNLSRRTRYAAIPRSLPLERALAAPPWEERHFVEAGGHLAFTRGDYPRHLADIAFVKVGAVSGADTIYTDTENGNRDFVCSKTVKSGATRRMLWVEPGDPPPACLLPHKPRLIARRVQPFDEHNWWHWGRNYFQSDRPRLYVNGRTRQKRPFFVHPCRHYDGSILAIFPHDPLVDPQVLADALNEVDWTDLGFVCDGRFLFTQRSLENAPLPSHFTRFAPSLRTG